RGISVVLALMWFSFARIVTLASGTPRISVQLNTAPAGTPAADNLALLASWAATQQTLATELEAHNG
ncbi:hypothetical protein ACFXPL_24010, partial [Streptomyces sp. NPDC059092]